MDLVVFVVGFQAKIEFVKELQAKAQAILTKTFPETVWRKPTSYALRFHLQGVDVDLLFTGSAPNGIVLCYNDPIGRFYMSSLVKLQVTEFKNQLNKVAKDDPATRERLVSIVRCLKRWKAKRMWSKGGPKSYSTLR